MYISGGMMYISGGMIYISGGMMNVSGVYVYIGRTGMRAYALMADAPRADEQ